MDDSWKGFLVAVLAVIIGLIAFGLLKKKLPSELKGD